MRPLARAFTLIELLVVIAIIGLLSSVVLASLSSARLRAADASLIEQAGQLRNLFELEYSEKGSYAGLEQAGGWWGNGQSCSAGSGNYASQAQNICSSMLRSEATPCAFGGCVYFNTVSTNDPGKYSILVYLPYQSAQAGEQRYLCLGSSGARSITNAVSNGWADSGCWANP